MPKKKSTLEKLRNQLIELSGEIDEQGLLFLIKQANTLIYNRKVDELNQQAEALEQSKANQSALRQDSASGEEAYPVTVERGAFGASYILCVGRVRKTLSEEEMFPLVKVCHAARDRQDGMARTYRWFKRNRDDILLDLGITSPKHIALSSIHEALTAIFQIRENDK